MVWYSFTFCMSLFSVYLLWLPVKQGKMLWKVWTVAEGTHAVVSIYQCTSLLSYHTLTKEKQHNWQKPAFYFFFFLCVGFKRQWQRRKNWRRAVTSEQPSFDRVFLNFRLCSLVTISSALLVALILFNMRAAEMPQVTNELNQQGCLWQNQKYPSALKSLEVLLIFCFGPWLVNQHSGPHRYQERSVKSWGRVFSLLLRVITFSASSFGDPSALSFPLPRESLFWRFIAWGVAQQLGFCC